MLNLTSEYVNQLSSDEFAPCFLVKLPVLTLTTGPDDVSFNGETYVSGGLTISLDSYGSTTDISANTYTITLDNADQTAFAIYANDNYIGADVTIYMALLNDDSSLVVDGSGDGPFEVYKGIFDGWAVVESTTTSAIKIKVKSHWAAFNRKAGRFTNSASQQEIYPTDTFFQYSHEDVTDMRWMTAK